MKIVIFFKIISTFYHFCKIHFFQSKTQNLEKSLILHLITSKVPITTKFGAIWRFCLIIHASPQSNGLFVRETVVPFVPLRKLKFAFLFDPVDVVIVYYGERFEKLRLHNFNCHKGKGNSAYLLTIQTWITGLVGQCSHAWASRPGWFLA